MKYQCVHSDTGLCETCFKYETELSALKSKNAELTKQVETLRMVDSNQTMHINAYIKEKEFLEAKVAELTATNLELVMVEGRLRDALLNYGEHDKNCILSVCHAGRPKEGGGYECLYGYGENKKWYDDKELPKCECGLDEALLTPQPSLSKKVMTVIETAKVVIERTASPGMEDPFNNGWRWRYRLEDALNELDGGNDNGN